MPIVISPDSAYGQELAKWNTPRNKPVVDSSGDPVREGGSVVMGKGAIGFEPYPMMLYRAQTHPVSGQVRCMDVEPDLLSFDNTPAYERALNQIVRFNNACTLIVRSEDEERKAKNDGWSPTREAALAAAERQAIEISELSARRLYSDRTMSDAAQREAAAADKATSKHVLDVVGGSKRTIHREKDASGVTA